VNFIRDLKEEINSIINRYFTSEFLIMENFIVACDTDKYRNPTYSMFGNTGILRAVILQKTQVVRVNVVMQKRINVRIFEKPIIWNF
jgi:hypothetical protein